MPEPDPGDMGTAFGLDAILGAAEAPLPTQERGREEPAWHLRLDRRPRR